MRKDGEIKNFLQKEVISFYCQYLKKMILNYETYYYARDFNSGVTVIMKKHDKP